MSKRDWFLTVKKSWGTSKIFNINSADLNFELEHGINYKQAMERIHAFKSDSSVIYDIEVFQEAYDLIGLGFIYAPTKLPIIKGLFKFIYSLWAKYRLKITFRPSIEELCLRRCCRIYQ